MRVYVLFVLVAWIGLAAAGTVCPSCVDLGYTCVPENYIYDGCAIASSTCPVSSCTANCQGLYGSSYTGSCSATMFDCICTADSGPVSTGPAGSPPATKTVAPAVKSNVIGTTTVTIAAFTTSASLDTDGTINAGTGIIVSLVLAAAVCVVVIIAIFGYVWPNWVSKDGRKTVGIPFAGNIQL